MDRNLSTLLKWGIENSTTTNHNNNRDPTASSTTTTTTASNGTSTATPDQQQLLLEPAPASAPAPAPVPASRNNATTFKSDLTPELLKALLGGPSDADLMRAAMEAINSPDPEVTLDDRLVAFDNFEQLIESLDNANNMEKLGLWTPLLECLAHDEKDIRLMAAWCVGTAVQNNERTQERLAAIGTIGIPRLVSMAVDGKEPADVKKKALYALSSACRNYQPAMDLLSEELGKRGVGPTGKTDAMDMEAVSAVIDPLRDWAR